MSVKVKRIISRTLTHAVLILLGTFFLLPFLWMLSTALKPNEQLYASPPVWIPHPMVWENFKRATEFIPFFSYMRNSFGVAVMDVIGTVIACPLAAYGLSRLEWKGRDLLFFVTIAVMMIPTEVTMVPTFILYSKMNLVGTYIPLFIQSFFGRPFMIFLLRQFFMNLPRDLEDAARIDGAGELKIYSQIILPLVVPGILTVALFRFMNSWNDFIGPLLYLNKEELYTLPIGLQMFTTQYKTEWQMLMAASLMTTLPVVFIYFLVQKRFIEGITFSGIKG
ncbi:MAG: carbohydrate ABC transporter permease [Aristaeellaceae bacterium]